MLPNKFEMPLDLAIKPSKQFYSYLCVVFLLALISILISDVFPLMLRIFLVFILITSSTLIVKKNFINHVLRLSLNRDGIWTLSTNNTERFEAELYGECIVTSFLIWLNFSNDKGKKFHVLLFPDSADKELLRQLRVRLRFLKPALNNNFANWNKV